MEQEKGVLRTFPIFGRTLVVPERLDLFNSYRLRFRETALRLTDAAESAYHTYIHDFDSFIEHFIGIYRCMLEPAVKEAFDILISNGAWNINYEAFWEGFWGIIKRERYYGKKFTSREALVKMIEDYIEYYNHKRLQRNLGVLTPFEKHEQYMWVA